MGEMNQERVDNVVLDLALELDEPAAELLAYRSMLVAVNSILHGPAQPQAVAPLRVVRACALRSAIGLVVAILIPPSRPLKKAHNRKRKPERNLMQIFVLPEKYPAVADRLTALNQKRGKLPDPHRLAEARSRHTELIASERYEGVKGLRHSIAPFGEVEPVECSDAFWLADQIDACVTELWLGIGLVRRPDRFPGEDAALFRETAAWQRRS